MAELRHRARAARRCWPRCRPSSGRHGRQRPYRNAPRTLDLDLLLYGGRRRRSSPASTAAASARCTCAPSCWRRWPDWRRTVHRGRCWAASPRCCRGLGRAAHRAHADPERRGRVGLEAATRRSAGRRRPPCPSARRRPAAAPG
ncbi:MAG: hypothetical protein MZW92_71160 [Comamonadaceae bacterium]|nr:hypothetical protein [Comamonadaceae bacterium]